MSGHGAPRRDPLLTVSAAHRHLVHQAAFQDPPLRPVELRLLLAITAFTTGWTRLEDCVTHEQLSQWSRVTDRKQLRQGLRSLRERGLIGYTPGRGRAQGGGGKPSRIALVVPQADQPALAGSRAQMPHEPATTPLNRASGSLDAEQKGAAGNSLSQVSKGVAATPVCSQAKGGVETPPRAPKGGRATPSKGGHSTSLPEKYPRKKPTPRVRGAEARPREGDVATREGEDRFAATPTPPIPDRATLVCEQLIAAVTAREDLPAGGRTQLRGWRAPLQAAVEQRLAEGWTGEDLVENPAVVAPSWTDAAHAGRVLTSRLRQLADVKPPAVKAEHVQRRDTQGRAQAHADAARKAAEAAARDQALAHVAQLEPRHRQALTQAARSRCCVPHAWPDHHPRVRDAEATMWQALLARLGRAEAVVAHLADGLGSPEPDATRRPTAPGRATKVPAHPQADATVNVPAALRMAERCSREGASTEVLLRLTDTYPPEVQHRALKRYAETTRGDRLPAKTASTAGDPA